MMSDDSVNFATCDQISSLSGTEYQDAHEVYLTDTEASSSKSVVIEKNAFEYIQLAEVVAKVNDNGKFHVSRKSVFELTNICNDPSFCLTLSSLVQVRD